MATNYPGGLDSLNNPGPTTKYNDAGFEHDVQHANANDAIEAIQAELGTNPSGSYATVKDRLDAFKSLGDAWQGAWDSGTSYAAGDVVAHNGSSWLAVDASDVGVEPGTVGSALAARNTNNLWSNGQSMYWDQRFTVSQRVTILGGGGYAWNPSASSTATITLYDVTHSVTLATGTVTLDTAWPHATFTEPVVLDPGVTYRLRLGAVTGGTAYWIGALGGGTNSPTVPWLTLTSYDVPPQYQYNLTGGTSLELLYAPANPWELVAQKGDTGATGATGPQGPAGATGFQGPAGVDGSIVSTWSGDWSAATAYSAGVVVAHAGGSWLALDATDPGDEPGGAAGSAEIGRVTISGGGSTDNRHWQQFTVTVTSEVTHAATVGGGTAAITAADGTTVLATFAGSAVSDDPGALQVLSTPVTLSAGTNYFIRSSSSGAYHNVGPQGAETGIVDSNDGVRYSSPTGSYQFDSTWRLPFVLGGPQIKWAALAEPGATGPAGPMPSRATATYTTASLANNAEETGTVTMAKSYRLLKLQADRACRVRVYDTAAHRTADAARSAGTDPTGDHGVMLDYVFTGAATVTLSPTVDGFNGESTPAATIPVAVQNTSGATSAVVVTFTYIAQEA